jgi:nicotinate-nucleotide adenylyltransferase
MKIGLLFGSFNPVHNGHVVIANGLAKAAKVDEVWWVLSPQNPFKQNLDLLPFEYRLTMLKSIMKHQSNFRVCTIEQDLPKPSYTIDTMDKLSNIYPDFRFSLFGGEDLMNQLHLWKSYEELLARYSFYIYRRSGSRNPVLEHKNIHLTDFPMMDVSSTEIRHKVKERTSIAGLIDPSVEALIQHYGWYR